MVRMFRGGLMTAALTVALALPAHAAGWAISGFVGAGIPTGDFADIDAETGLRFGGAVDYVFNDMWWFGVDGSYNMNEHADVGVTESDGSGGTYTLDEDDYTTWQFGGHAKYMIPVGDGPIHPYGVAGVGVSGTKEEYTETFTFGGSSTTQSGESTSDAAFAWKLGAGAMYMFNPQWGVGAEADYNSVSADGITLSWIGVQGVITFMIPMP